MATTLDSIPLEELGRILRPQLVGRRLFVSACSMTRHPLALSIFETPGCLSILGPDEEIGFGDAAVLWASLYHVMFAGDPTAMKRDVLQARAQEIAELYRVRLRYFTRDDASDLGYRGVKIIPRRERSGSAAR